MWKRRVFSGLLLVNWMFAWCLATFHRHDHGHHHQIDAGASVAVSEPESSSLRHGHVCSHHRADETRTHADHDGSSHEHPPMLDSLCPLCELHGVQFLTIELFQTDLPDHLRPQRTTPDRASPAIAMAWSWQQRAPPMDVTV